MKTLAFALILTFAPVAFAETKAPGEVQEYHTRPEVLAFIDEMVTEEGFNRDALVSVFREASYKQSIIDAISRPAEKVLTWKEYQDIFLTTRRIEQGWQFIEDNALALAAAEDEYGVPAEIVAAIIGVETMYGQIRGNYRVIDALATLAFDYPPRSKFFRSELKQFLLLTREEKQSPIVPKGSYAGAMGYGQFISSSYRHYAIDFDGDGFRDIWENRIDAIGSVANYLKEHGWLRDEIITVPVSPADAHAEHVFSEELAPWMTVSELTGQGVSFPGVNVEGLGATKVSPLMFNGKAGPEYWAGFRNFYVITRYNHSKLYAMAVFQLSEKLKSERIAKADVQI